MQQDLGRMLRRWRDRIPPEQVGLPAGARRRAPGLRREELALLAGISVDYLTRLEQGRASSPSEQVLEALARALRLSDAERELLFRLTGQPVPGPGTVPQRIPPSTRRLLDRLAGTPVVVFDAVWNLLESNAPYEAISGASAWRGIERNAVWRNLVGPGPIAVLDDDELAAQQAGLVADLRVSAATYASDARVGDLVRRLRRHSPRFAELWDRADLRPRGQRSRRKLIVHPEAGPMTLDCDTLVVADEDLRVMVYTAEPGSVDAERLAAAVASHPRAGETEPATGPAAW